MPLDLAANDWEVCGVAQAGGAAAIGGGAWFFLFRSSRAKIEEGFAFFGGGIGFGGSAGGTMLDTDGKLNYSPIVCESYFSVLDLNLSVGRVTNAAVSMACFAAGYSVISAFNTNGPLFTSQESGGVGVGGSGGMVVKNKLRPVSGSAITTVGIWRSMSCMAKDSSSAATGYLDAATGRRPAGR